MIEEALRLNASDIHLLPHEQGWRVHLRVEGLLQDESPSHTVPFDEVVSRLKVLAGMNIAQKKLPQDGHFRHVCNNRNIDLRVATLPSVFGEAVVLRLFDRERSPFELQRLGMPVSIRDKLEELVDRPSGLILVAGPVGSGKTTTLYSLLSRLAKQGKKIVTVEDPVEARVQGALQVEICEGLGLDFARALRASVRHDPDILMIGEIRDSETARVALHAAVLGHLVLASIHAESALLAIERLIHMGVDRYRVATAVTAVIAQRLIRLDGPSPEVKTLPGRKGLFELLIPDNSLKEEILSGAAILRNRPNQLQSAGRALLLSGLIE